MTTAEANRTDKAAAVAAQGAHVAPEKVPAKKAATQKKGAPKGKKAAKGAKPKAKAKPTAPKKGATTVCAFTGSYTMSGTIMRFRPEATRIRIIPATIFVCGDEFKRS